MRLALLCLTAKVIHSILSFLSHQVFDEYNAVYQNQTKRQLHSVDLKQTFKSLKLKYTRSTALQKVENFTPGKKCNKNSRTSSNSKQIKRIPPRHHHHQSLWMAVPLQPFLGFPTPSLANWLDHTYRHHQTSSSIP
jgi:hypothetical protein